jgi:hypothetical protein
MPDIPTDLSLSTLLERWQDAWMRSFFAKHDGQRGAVNPADLFAELAYGTVIAREVTAGRWCVVADLLRLGLVESWAQIGEALAITETEARDGFARWISGQRDLYERTGTIGITGSEAEKLHRLAEAVIL